MATPTILVPIDFSKSSTHALEQAAELAQQLSAKLVLFHSYYVDVSQAPKLYWVVPPDFLETLRQTTSAELEKLAKHAIMAGVPWECSMSAEPAVPAILALAESLPAHMIVMGTRGNTGLKHVVLGSTAERIVRLAPCPVLTVKERTS